MKCWICRMEKDNVEWIEITLNPSYPVPRNTIRKAVCRRCKTNELEPINRREIINE